MKKLSIKNIRLMLQSISKKWDGKYHCDYFQKMQSTRTIIGKNE